MHTSLNYCNYKHIITRVQGAKLFHKGQYKIAVKENKS